MRYLVVSNNYPPRSIGGAEIVAHSHAKIIKQLGAEVVCFAGEHSDPDHQVGFINKEHYEGIWCWRFRLDHNHCLPESNNLSNSDVASCFAECLQDFRPTHVHFHNLPGLDCSLPMLAKSSSAKTIVTLHDHWGYCYRQTLIKSNDELCMVPDCAKCVSTQFDSRLNAGEFISQREDQMTAIYRNIDLFVSPSKYLARQYVESNLPSGLRPFVLSNGVDLCSFYPAPLSSRSLFPQSKLRFGSSCYLGEHKGIKVIMQALKMLSTVTQNWHYSIAGAGHLEHWIRYFIEEHGLSDNCTLLGKQDHNDMPSFYRSIDVFILASIWPENQPCTLLESQATGVPSICSWLGGTPEIIEDNVNGFLVEPSNPAQLASKLNEYVQCRDRLRLHSDNALKSSIANSLGSSALTLYQALAEL